MSDYILRKDYISIPENYTVELNNIVFGSLDTNIIFHLSVSGQISIVLNINSYMFFFDYRKLLEWADKAHVFIFGFRNVINIQFLFLWPILAAKIFQLSNLDFCASQGHSRNQSEGKSLLVDNSICWRKEAIMDKML